MTALVLLAPGTPMLFQGQEFAASSPFFYFADHSAELGPLIAKGRREFLRQFPSIGSIAAEEFLEDPAGEETFLRSKLDFSERQKHAGIYRLHSDLLRQRREDAVFARPQKQRIDGAVLGSEAFVLRYFGDAGSDRLLLVNLGRDLHLDPAPEPLLAPPFDAQWKVVLSTEEPIYDGGGTSAIESDENWHLPGQAAVVLASTAVGNDSHERTDPTH
jgi:maltooligosyltrehalose trehalohydrolase